MCGIVGLISKNQAGFWSSHVDIFTDMLIMDQLRGMDGTGVFGVYKNRQAFLTKAGTHASNFTALKDYAQFKERMLKSMTMVFGHNRKATVGDISSVNSHPFFEDNIIGIHNGFIGNASTFDSKAAVDSQALFRGLNKGEPKDILSRVQGAYALVWYDKRDKTLRVARNAERPLYVADTDNFMAFASEPWMIFAALSKHRRNVDVKIKDCEEVEKHKIFEFQPGGALKTVDYKPTTVVYYNNRWTGMCDDGMCDPWEGYQGARHSDTRPTHSRPQTHNTPSISRMPGLREEWVKLIDELPAVTEEISFRVKSIGAMTIGGETTHKVMGEVVINNETVDVNGEVDWAKNEKEIDDMLGIDYQKQRWAYATVDAKGVTTSGPWVRVKDIFAPSMVTTWNKHDIAQFVWDRVVKKCSCDKCKGPIQSKEAPYTSVSTRIGGDVIRVICAKCVTEAFEKEQNAKTSSDSSVQVGQPVGQNTLH